MDKYSNRKREPLARLAVEKETKAMDNLTLDVLDAERLGYGPHYGHFKADHPQTAEANRDRLKPKKETRIKKVYEFSCMCCGHKFTTTNGVRRYCSAECKMHHNGANARARKKKKTGAGNERKTNG